MLRVVIIIAIACSIQISFRESEIREQIAIIKPVQSLGLSSDYCSHVFLANWGKSSDKHENQKLNAHTDIVQSVQLKYIQDARLNYLVYNNLFVRDFTMFETGISPPVG